MKIQVTIDQLERIVDAAKRAKKTDSSLSDTLTMESTIICDTHNGGDMIVATLKSGYQECDGQVVYWNRY